MPAYSSERIRQHDLSFERSFVSVRSDYAIVKGERTLSTLTLRIVGELTFHLAIKAILNFKLWTESSKLKIGVVRIKGPASKVLSGWRRVVCAQRGSCR